MKIVGGIFEKMKMLHFFLCELPLILRVDRKKKQAGDICKGTLDIESERDRPVGLASTLGGGEKITNLFYSFRDFFGKVDSVILLGFEYTTNPENLIKIAIAIFEKIKEKFFLV